MALILAGGGLLSYESQQYRAAATREMSALAEIVAAGSTAALSFGDKQAARETLASLHGDRRLLRAVVYDKAGNSFAAYDQPGTGAAAAPGHPRPDDAYFEQGTLLLFQPIKLTGERIGTVLLVSSTSEVQTRLKRYAGIVAVVLVGSLLLSLLAMARLQRVITGPIAYLSEVAQQVSSERNYSLRAKKSADDEIGLLIDSFNDMLVADPVAGRIAARKRGTLCAGGPGRQRRPVGLEPGDQGALSFLPLERNAGLHGCGNPS